MKLLVVANWKCNPVSLAEAKRLFNLVKRGIKKMKKVEVVICPPFIYLSSLKTNGAQDCFLEKSGAFTGEISPKQLFNLGCQYVIIGHSERRRYQKETDEMINIKIKAALKEKLKPILCVENISQLKKGLKGLSVKDLKNVIIAYEPVFAIGTGKPCSIEKAKKMRFSIKRSYKNVSVLYGGSVNSQNAGDYVESAGFQGLLVGSASLKAKEFLKIVRSINEN